MFGRARSIRNARVDRWTNTSYPFLNLTHRLSQNRQQLQPLAESCKGPVTSGNEIAPSRSSFEGSGHAVQQLRASPPARRSSFRSRRPSSSRSQAAASQPTSAKREMATPKARSGVMEPSALTNFQLEQCVLRRSCPFFALSPYFCVCSPFLATF